MCQSVGCRKLACFSGRPVTLRLAKGRVAGSSRSSSTTMPSGGSGGGGGGAVAAAFAAGVALG
eukprot:12879875-Prorocentrum_lima.AAC.1